MITKGEIVLYTLSADDAEKINRRRTTGDSIAERMKAKIEPTHGESQSTIKGWPAGAQAHIGNGAKEGAQYAAIVVEDWKQQSAASGVGGSDSDDAAVNLQVFLDGNDVYWATSRLEDSSKSPAPGTWSRR